MIPLSLALKLTIPMVADAATFDRVWFTRAAGLSPMFATVYFSGGIPPWWQAGIAAALGALFSYGAWLGTRDDSGDAFWWLSCGTSFPIGAAIVGLYGFFISAIWIGILAEEIVGIIHVFGIIGHIQSSILGLTVLAWGNSLTDLLANITIAMSAESGVSMAMTACFAGPLFNILLGLGFGFAMYFSETGTTSQAISFDAEVLIGCIFAMANCIGVIVIAVKHDQTLPAWSGWLMMSWYGVYMALVVALQLSRVNE